MFPDRKYVSDFVDFSDVKNPVEIARYELPGHGSHNYWIDNDILYVGMYTGGVRIVDISGDLLGDLYKQGREPDKLFNNFMGSITKYMKTGSDDDMISIQNYFGNFNRQLTEIIDDQYVFDLTTDLGKAKFNTFKNMLEANIYSKWAKPIIEKAENIDPRIGKQLKQDTGGYNFGELNVNRLDEVSEAVQVKINTPSKIPAVCIPLRYSIWFSTLVIFLFIFSHLQYGVKF